MIAKRNLLWASGLLCAGVMLTCPVTAEVIPVTILTGRGTGAPEGAPSIYTVPSGKVLIVEAVKYRLPSGVEPPTEMIAMFRLTPHNFASRRNVFVDLGPWDHFERFTFDPPMRVSAGDMLDSNRTSGYYLWFGLLVDETDLFASLDVELLNPRVESGKLIADAKVASPRPRRITAETADDLLNAGAFLPDLSATVARGASTSEDIITVDLGEGDQMFLRASAVARPN